jgi:hypothetical protein
MSRPIAVASAGKPNSIVADIRDGVTRDESASAFKGGFSAADAIEPGIANQSAVTPARANRKAEMWDV